MESKKALFLINKPMNTTRRSYNTRVQLGAVWGNRSSHVIDKQIVSALQTLHGNRCHEQEEVYYLYADSIRLVERGEGVLNTIVYDGSLLYQVTFTADVCTFPRGTKLTCAVLKRNEEGILCRIKHACQTASTVESPFIVMLPIRWHPPKVQKTLRNMDMQTDDVLHTQVLGSRFDPSNVSTMQIIVELDSNFDLLSSSSK